MKNKKKRKNRLTNFKLIVVGYFVSKNYPCEFLSIIIHKIPGRIYYSSKKINSIDLNFIFSLCSQVSIKICDIEEYDENANYCFFLYENG